MKAKLFFSALVAIATMSAWAQAPIVNFPQELGTADYGKVGDVPKEFKDATSVLYKTEVDGNIIAEYIGIYGYPYICSFDSDMNMYFPPKEFSDKKTRYIGVNEAEQVVVAKVAKKGTDVCLLDKQMNLVKSLNIIYADVYFDKSIGHMSVENDKIFLILWQYESKKVQHWMGYILDANTLEILSQTDMGSSYHSQFVYSDNKKYIGCVAVDDTKGKYLYHPLYNGANIKLYDNNFSLIQERYVYGNIDDPWVHAQEPKEIKKIYNGGMTGIKTDGEYHVLINDDGVLRYITLDAASVHKVTATRNYTFQIRDNRLALYTLSSTRNDSISVSDDLAGKSFGSQSVLSVSDDSVKMLVWCDHSRNELSWNLKENKINLASIDILEYNTDPNTFQRILYRSKFEWILENMRKKDKVHVSYEMWRSPFKDYSHFPLITSDAMNGDKEINGFVKYVMPKEIRSLLAYSTTTDVYCFLVHESLNNGFNSTPPIETTRPLYIDFFGKEGKLAEFVFPHSAYEIINGKKAYQSLINLNAFQIDETSILFYLKYDGKHQWVTLSPNLFDANYKAAHPEKF